MSLDVDWSRIERFDWDRGNLEHIQKYDVNYRECEESFLNKQLILNKDTAHSQAEERYRVYGKQIKEEYRKLF